MITGGLLLGMLSGAPVDAQQTSGWSPQPFVRHNDDRATAAQSSVPTNSLRSNVPSSLRGSATGASASEASIQVGTTNATSANRAETSEASTSGDVVRWGKVTLQAKDIEKKNFSEVLPSQRRTQVSTSDSAQQLVIRQPTMSGVASRPVAAAAPELRTGFGRLATATQNEPQSNHDGLAKQHSSSVQLASFAESSESTSVDNRSSGVWYAKDSAPTGLSLGEPNGRSQRTNVQKARYQEPDPVKQAPIFPDALPPAREPMAIPMPINPGAMPEEAPKLNPSQSSKPNRSVLEPDDVRPNPFNGSKAPNSSDRDRSPSDASEPPALGTKDRDLDREDLDAAPLPPMRRGQSGVDCDAVRLLANDFDITKIAVDSSPDFVKGITDRRRPNANTKEAFIANASVRPWLNYDGQVVAEGKLVDMRLGAVIIEKSDGTRTSYLLHKLCDADQAYVSENWGLPVTCAIDDRSFPSRQFVDTTVTWKASGACHKPLYFEDVQLERYGHEWGPVAQPIMSTAHFFGDVLVLPYKMGIHPMNECQYSLGHYRPGNCAPWTVGPVPISLRGALMQGKVITGAALLLP